MLADLFRCVPKFLLVAAVVWFAFVVSCPLRPVVFYHVVCLHGFGSLSFCCHGDVRAGCMFLSHACFEAGVTVTLLLLGARRSTGAIVRFTCSAVFFVIFPLCR